MNPTALCSVCGDEFAVPGEDLCLDCLAETKERDLVAEIQAVTARRAKLLGSLAAGTLQRLKEQLETAILSENGRKRCPRLDAGHHDCFCEFCKAYWSGLQSAARGRAWRRPTFKRPAAARPRRLRRAG